MSNVRPEPRKVEQTQERSHTVAQGNLQNSGPVSGGNGQPQTGFWAHLQHNQDVFLRKKYFNPF